MENDQAIKPELIFSKGAELEEKAFKEWVESSGKVVYDYANNRLWAVRKGGDEKEETDRIKMDGKRFCQLVERVDQFGGLQELIAKGIEIDVRNWKSNFKTKADMEEFMRKVKVNSQRFTPVSEEDSPIIANKETLRSDIPPHDSEENIVYIVSKDSIAQKVPVEYITKDLLDKDEKKFIDWVHSSNHVIYDYSNFILWTVKPGGDREKPEDCTSLGISSLMQLLDKAYYGGVANLVASGVDLEICNWGDFDIPGSKEHITEVIKNQAKEISESAEDAEPQPAENKLSPEEIERQGTKAMENYQKLKEILDRERTPIEPPLTPEKNEAALLAKTKYEQAISKATGKFLDGVEYYIDKVPDNIIIQAAISATELFGFGYSLLDIPTALSGIRDLLGGRAITKDENRNKAYTRGVLKIVGAVVPFPSYWVNAALKNAMPVQELDNKPKNK